MLASAVIFDFDGVIVGSERMRFSQLKRLLRPKNLYLKKSDFKNMVGKRTTAFLKERFGKKLTLKEVIEIAENRRVEELVYLKKHTKLISGVKPLIKLLRTRGIKLAVATGSRRKIVNTVLRRSGLLNYFDVLITGEDFESSKPNPEVYKLALAKLKTSAKNTVVIEDSPAGVLAAKRAGISCIAITTTQPKMNLKKADIVANSFKEISKLFVTKKRVCLVVLDGWGVAHPGPGNAIWKAKPVQIVRLAQDYPSALLEASGKDVGLLPGMIGNSEVGHLNLGAGRLVKQDVTRIFESIKNGSFYRNKYLKKSMRRKTVHLMGLMSDAGVHSHLDHLFALLRMAKKNKVKQVYVHAITDGRDVPPKSAEKYITEVERELKRHSGNWKIATVSGRYYAMDRDSRWNRTKKAYSAIVQGKGRRADSALEAVKIAYKKKETDEFITPTIIDKEGNLKQNDGIVFFNFRNDRAKQITTAIVQSGFKKFSRRKVKNLYFVCMAQYDPKIKADIAFVPVKLKNTLGEVLSKKGLKQFRLAETEKWAHVTYFFNGLTTKVFSNEQRLLIPSPKVTTYDKTPAMSANKITKKALSLLNAKKHSFLLVNFANADMVGHTGNISATVKAIKVVERSVMKIVAACQKNDWELIVTGDHGNAEHMRYADGSIATAHTTNKVPFILISAKSKKLRKVRNAALHHVAPTILRLFGIKKPKEMEKGLLP